jgi:anti-sigma B factor antagonist
MKMEVTGDTLRVLSVLQLGEANAKAFRDWVRAALEEGHKNIEVDLSQTTFIDSSGLGALVALHKTAASRRGRLRLVNPQPSVQQILELTRLDGILEIVKQSSP